MTTYYCVSSLPLPYGIRVTTITLLRTTVRADCPCPTRYALLLLHDYVLLCEQFALALRHTRYYYYVLLCEQLVLALRHTRYYYYMTTYYCVSSLPLPYGIRVTTIIRLRTTALQPTRYYYYMITYYCVSSLPLPYGIRVTTITLLRTTV